MQIITCTKCGIDYPYTSEFFYKNMKYCKSCHNIICKQYRNDNADIIRKRKRIYREKNKELFKKSQRKWYEKNKEYIFEKQKTYTYNRKEYFIKYWYDNKETRKKYKQNNKDKYNYYSQKRRSIKSKLKTDYTVSEWNECKKKFDNKCAYCGKETNLEQEHFIPLSKGGEYTKNNIIPACKSCNSSKQSKDFFEWYSQQEFYSKNRKEDILKYLNI